ncbi:putative methyltransferase-domain-containing protein [Phycomyces nitens]|nr:putative methyltransferase-domain-containing protein [Phycomyces nitens]
MEGWEDGAKYKRELFSLDRWELQSADQLTIHVGPHDIVLVQDPHSSHLGGYIWLTAIVFCAYLESLCEKKERHGWISLDRTKRWVELGSGVGLIGIMLRKMGIEDVMITDISELVPVMERNVEANGFTVKSVSGRRKNEASHTEVLVEPLLWGDGDAIEHVKSSGTIDYLVACDCIYSEASALDLVDTMDRLADETTTIICISEVRNQAAQDAFMAEAKSRFHMELLPPSQWQGKVKGVAFAETLNLYRLRKSAARIRKKRTKNTA